MVDVTDKKPSERIAVAQGVVSMKQETFEMIQSQKVKTLRLQELRELWQRKKLRILFPCVTR